MFCNFASDWKELAGSLYREMNFYYLNINNYNYKFTSTFNFFA